MSSSRVVGLIQKLDSSAAAFREVYASLVSVISEMRDADVAHLAGYRRLSLLVSDVTRLNPRFATRLITHAEVIAEVVTPTGHVTPARLPVVREALLAGDLDAEQVDAVVRTVKKIPDWAPGDTVEVVEKHLVAMARTGPAHVLAKHGETLLARIDPDGDQPAEVLAAPKNVFRYRRDEAGWMHFTGIIDPESAEELDSMLGALAKPGGPEDERHPTQRLGDAFCDVVHHALTSDKMPVRGGVKPHLNATVDLEVLRKGVGTATLEGGALLGAAAARRLACDAGDHADGDERCVGPVGCGPHPPPGHPRPAGSVERSGWWVCVPELRSSGAVGGCASHSPLARRRRHRPREHGAPLPKTPPDHSPFRVGSADERGGDSGIHSASVD